MRIHAGNASAYFMPVVLLIALAGLARSDTFEWTEPVNGVFNDGGNWKNITGVDPAPPNIGDDIEFNEAGSYTITLKRDEVADEIFGGAGDVALISDSSTRRTLTLATGSADANISGGKLTIGSPTNPVFLTLPNSTSGGGQSISVMNVGSGSDGFVTVDGFMSRLNVNGNTNHSLGLSGAFGGLFVSNSALADIGTQGGTLRIGVSSISNSQGDVTAVSGGRVSAGHIQIATNTSGAIGSLNVIDSGSRIEQTLLGSDLIVGSSSGGLGSVGLFDSGELKTSLNGEFTVNATGQVNVQGGTLTVRGNWNLPSLSNLNFTDGSINVSGTFSPDYSFTYGGTSGDVPTFSVGGNDAIVEFGSDWIIAPSAGQSGRFNIASSNLLGDRATFRGSSPTSSLVVGGRGVAEMNVTGGGLADIPNDVRVASSSTGNGTVNVGPSSSGQIESQLKIGNDLLLGVDAAGGNRGTAQLNINDDGFVGVIGSTRIGSGDNLHVTGGRFESFGPVVMNAGSNLLLDGGFFTMRNGLDNSGDATFNFDDGQLTIAGGAFLPNSSGDLEIDGATAGDAPHLLFIGPSSNSYATVTIGNDHRGSISIREGIVSSSEVEIAKNIGSEGTVTVSNEDSQWLVSGSLTVGGSRFINGGTGSLSVNNNGLVRVDGILYVNDAGTLILDGGNLVALYLDLRTEAEFQFIAGSLSLDRGFDIGGSSFNRIFPNSIALNPEQHLATTSTTRVQPFRSLTLNGGSLTTHHLDVDGFLRFNSGTLELTGGVVSGMDQFIVPTAGELRAVGTYAVQVVGAIGSRIAATGDLELGNAILTNGFATAGALAVNGHTVTLFDANDVVFDSLASVHLGDDQNNAGTLVAANGLTLDFGGNIAGFGTVETSNNPAVPFINNGNVTGNSVSEPVTLTGYVKGVGTMDNVLITGTDAPGFSSASVNRGTVEYAGTLEIELGGNSVGQYDTLQHILGNGEAVLGGELLVRLLDDHVPLFGDTYEFIHAVGGVSGVFASERLPDLDGGLFLDVLYGSNSVQLVVVGAPGDLNGDGAVDAADASILFTNWGTVPPGDPIADINGDGVVDAADASGIFTNWTGDPQSQPVPEPSTVGMLITCVLVLLAIRDKAIG